MVIWVKLLPLAFVFSRDAGTGENLFNGEYLINAQGEDVVAGIRTPQEITLEGS